MKNLEKEYKEQISLETPDLWSRIEAGVDAYESSKKEAAPSVSVTDTDTKVVRFDTKKFINIIGKISVAAVLILAVAATYNVTRKGKSDSSTATEAAIADMQNASEATESYDSFKEAESAEMSESPIINDSPSVITNPESDSSYSKDTYPTLSPSEAIRPGELESDTNAEDSMGESADIRLIDKSARDLALSWDDAFIIYKGLTELGLTDITELKAEKDSVDGSLIYGPDYKDISLNVAGFFAGEDKIPYLLFYRTESGIEIIAVKNNETGEFIYINPTE